MKETKLVKDQYNSIKLRDMKPDEFIKVKLHKYNSATEKDVVWTGGTFKSYSLNCLHNGEEVYLQLTAGVAKRIPDFEVGAILKIMAMKDAKLKGGKSYIVLEEESPLSGGSSNALDLPKDLLKAFKETLDYVNDNNLSVNDFDDTNIIITFKQDPYHFEYDDELILLGFKAYVEKYGGQ